MTKPEKSTSTPIGAIGEFGLIDRLTEGLYDASDSTIKGIGDDAAVLDHADRRTLVSTDMLIEGIHFDLAYTPLKHLGYKAVMVNLSDIYAMNGMAEQITVSLALSNRFSVEAVEELYSGIKLACDQYQVDIVGGDTTSSMQGLVISITAMGSAARDQVVLRSGAQEGDLLCVSGDLGAAYLGLQLLEREKQIYLEAPDVQPDLEDQQYLVQRQLRPLARKDVILRLAELSIVPKAMIDLSDGLASDLMHIARQSGVGAEIQEDWVPIHEEAKLMAMQFKMDPITCALSGGEDYELLFAVDHRHEDALHDLDDISVVGSVKPKEEGIYLLSSAGKRHEIIAQGWKHFNEGGQPSNS